MLEFMTLAADAAASIPAEAAGAAAGLAAEKALIYCGAFCAIGFAAIGSGWGAGCAASSAVGAWKKCYAQNKPAPFQLMIFAGAPLSQTIYGMILMFFIMGAGNTVANAGVWPFYVVTGILSGVAMGISAAWQGMAAAAACDAYAETGKGFTNQLTVLGIIETVAIFVMAFSLVLLSMF